MNKRHIATQLAASLLLAAASLSVQAEGNEAPADEASVQVRTVVVHYRTGVLSDEEGARELRSRLETAARRACGQFDSKQLYARKSWRACYESALADAIEQVGNQRVAAVD